MNVKLLFFAAGLDMLLLFACQSPGGDTAGSGKATDMPETNVDTIPTPARVQLLFGDSSNRALYWDNESVVETEDGRLRIDGLLVIYISQAELPLLIHTSLMDIEVLELPLLVRIDAFNKYAGQSLDLFSGTLKVSKSYESTFPDIDTLSAGNLYMINKDIDLSEKERLDDYTVLQWWNAVYSKGFPNAIADK